MSRIALRCVPWCLLLAVAACGGKPSTQVVATVNGQEITISQLRQQLRSDGAAAADEPSIKAAMDRLIEEELLVQKAQDSKIDRDPVVMQAIEKARRQILTRVYLDRHVVPKGEITEDELHAYYDANPQLFANRRIYHMEAFTVDASKLTATLQSAISAANDAEALQQQLVLGQVQFERRKASMPAEQLPMEYLADFGKARIGDVFVLPQRSGGTLLLSVSRLEDSPLSYEVAAPAIAEYLGGRRGDDALKAYLKQARSLAAVTYVSKVTADGEATQATKQSEIDMSKGVAGL